MTSSRPERPRVPIITVGLRPHPTSPDAAAPGTGPVGRLLATMFSPPEGGAVFEFRLEDSRLGKLAIPEAARAYRVTRPTDELWQHTCFEVFLGVPGEPQYREYNFSPSGQWACYAFRAWRERIEDFTPATAPEITCTQQDGTLALEAYVPPELLPTVPAGCDLQVSLTAVIERKDGQFEHWALRHVAAQPDFHARDTFVLTLATAARKSD
ncbi:MAG: DOMON-like domain-containing protein [Thauera sp.]